MTINNPSPAFDPFAQFLEFIPWLSLDAISVVNSHPGDGNCLVRGSKFAMWTGEVTGAYVYASFNFAWRDLFRAGIPMTWELPIAEISDVPAHQTIWLRLGEVVTHPLVDIDGHIGWKVVDSVIYASMGNNLGITLMDTGVAWADHFHPLRLKIVFTPGSQALYYIDDALVATITTNLKVEDYGKPFFYCLAQSDEYCTIELNRMLLQREYS